LYYNVFKIFLTNNYLYFVSGTKTPIKTEPVNNKTKIAQETITSTISSNASMTLQTPNANSSPTVLQTLDCTEMARR